MAAISSNGGSQGELLVMVNRTNVSKNKGGEEGGAKRDTAMSDRVSDSEHKYCAVLVMTHISFTDFPVDVSTTVQLLVTELQDVEAVRWKVFGVFLGVPKEKLDTIPVDDPHGGVENWKLRMFQLWLQLKPNASWKNVVQALVEIGHSSLAAKLKRKYLSGTTSNDQGKNYDKNLTSKH